ncbi:unnamed protein product [Moneuplotes crassus]|uniref:Uncharacterized protein n=1 Tax=Euplotes crassus TaxID=5936 RepID=A0AAD1Y2K6_EUPCR|nr:unnamed protein product [Moneuplotes crassus]
MTSYELRDISEVESEYPASSLKYDSRFNPQSFLSSSSSHSSLEEEESINNENVDHYGLFQPQNWNSNRESINFEALESEIRDKKDSYYDLYRQYDKITNKELIFDMNQKSQQKYDKCVDIFVKLINDFGIANEPIDMLFTKLEKNISAYNNIEKVLTTFIKKYLQFSDYLLINEIEPLRSVQVEHKKQTGDKFEVLKTIKKFLDIERVYCLIFWGYSAQFNENVNGSRQDLMGGTHRRRGAHSPYYNDTLNKSHLSSSESKFGDLPQDFMDYAKNHERNDSKNSGQRSAETNEVKSSISTSKSHLNPNDSFIIRRCMATIKRFRQLLFSINYILIHKSNDEHRDFFELFRQYNVEVFQALMPVLERKRFSSRSIQLIKAIYNMATELFNMDIFNQILNANMLSYYGLAEEYSVKVKDSYSKLSMNPKKVTLEEDKKVKENCDYFNIFQTNFEKPKKKKLRDTRVFTDPKLNYGARIQLLEYYMQVFYLKGGFSQYSTYEDLIEDKLIEVSDSSDEESDFLPPGGKPHVLDHKRFTFSKKPSFQDKRMTTSENSKKLETENERHQPRQSQLYSIVPSVIRGKKESFNNKDILHENALKEILESPEVSEKGDYNPRLGFDFESRTEEIPLEEEFSFEDYGFDDPFFTKLGLLQQNEKLKSDTSKKVANQLIEKKDQFWIDIINQREEEFQTSSLSRFQLKKMRKALENTNRTQIVSSLILSAHNPFSSGIPQMGNPDNVKNSQFKNKDYLVNSSFRNIFYSKEYGKPTGIQSIDNDLAKNGAEHLIYITERLMIPSMTEKLYCLQPRKKKKSEQEKARIRKILYSKTGFIDLINTYEEKKYETYRKLLKKESKEKARKEFEAKRLEEEGDLIKKNSAFNPYRKKLFKTATEGDVEYQVELDEKETVPHF